MWDNILLYDEHTWGAYNSITRADLRLRHPPVGGQGGLRHRRRPDDAAICSIAGLHAAGRSRERAGRLAAGVQPLRAASHRRGAGRHPARHAWSMDDNGPLPQQVVKEDLLEHVTVAFAGPRRAGRRLSHLPASPRTPASSPRRPTRFDGKVLENDFYRVTFDPKTGGVASMIDKKLEQGTGGPGEQVQARPGHLRRRRRLTGEKEWWVPGSRRRSSLQRADRQERPGRGTRAAVQQRQVQGGHEALPRHRAGDRSCTSSERRIDFVFRLNKEMTFDSEAVYVAFPFAGAKPQFRYEIGGGQRAAQRGPVPRRLPRLVHRAALGDGATPTTRPWPGRRSTRR